MKVFHWKWLFYTVSFCLHIKLFKCESFLIRFDDMRKQNPNQMHTLTKEDEVNIQLAESLEIKRIDVSYPRGLKCRLEREEYLEPEEMCRTVTTQQDCKPIFKLGVENVTENCAEQAEYCTQTFRSLSTTKQTILCSRSTEKECSDNCVNCEENCYDNPIVSCTTVAQTVAVTEKRQRCQGYDGLVTTKICITYPDASWVCREPVGYANCDSESVKLIAHEEARPKVECLQSAGPSICVPGNCRLKHNETECLSTNVPEQHQVLDEVCEQCVHGRTKLRTVVLEEQKCASTRQEQICTQINSTKVNWKKSCTSIPETSNRESEYPRFLNRPTPRPKELSSEILETLLNGIPFSSDSIPQNRNTDKDRKSGKNSKNGGSNGSADSDQSTNINRVRYSYTDGFDSTTKEETKQTDGNSNDRKPNSSTDFELQDTHSPTTVPPNNLMIKNNRKYKLDKDTEDYSTYYPFPINQQRDFYRSKQNKSTNLSNDERSDQSDEENTGSNVYIGTTQTNFRSNFEPSEQTTKGYEVSNNMDTSGLTGIRVESNTIKISVTPPLPMLAVETTSSSNQTYFPIADDNEDQNNTLNSNSSHLDQEKENNDNSNLLNDSQVIELIANETVSIEKDFTRQTTTKPIGQVATRDDSIVLPIISTSGTSGNSKDQFPNEDDSDYLYDLITSGEIQGILSDKTQEESSKNTNTIVGSTSSWLFDPVVSTNTRATPIIEWALEEYTDPEYVTGTTQQSIQSNIDWLYGTSSKYKSTRSVTIEFDQASTSDISESTDFESSTMYNTLSLLKDSPNDDIVLIETSTVNDDDRSDKINVNGDVEVDTIADNNQENKNTVTIDNNSGLETLNDNNGDVPKETNKSVVVKEERDDNSNNSDDNSDSSDDNSNYISDDNSVDISDDNSDYISDTIDDKSGKSDNNSGNFNDISDNSDDDSNTNDENNATNETSIDEKSFNSNSFDSSANLPGDENVEGYDANPTESLEDLDNDSDRKDLPADYRDPLDHIEQIDYEQELEENYVGNLKDDCDKLKNNKTRIYCKVYKCYNGILHECYSN